MQVFITMHAMTEKWQMATVTKLKVNESVVSVDRHKTM
jgi:hypothetical protein